MAKRVKDKDDDETETRVVRGAGDNAPDTEVSGKKLQGFLNSIEKLEAKKAQILQEIREEYAAAKAVGMDTKTIRDIVKERRMEPEKAAEMRLLGKIYREAIGMLDDE